MTNYLGSLSSEWEMYNAFSSRLICLVRLTIFEAEFFLPNTFCRTPILCNSEPLYPTWVGPMPQKHQWVCAGLQHCSGILSLYLTRWQNYKKVFTNFWGSSVFHCSLGSKETLLPSAKMNPLCLASPSSDYRWWVLSPIQDHWSTAALPPTKERNKSLLLLTPFYLNFNLLAHCYQLWCISNSKMAICLGVVPIPLAPMEAFAAPSMSACLRRGKANASKQHSGPALWNSPWGLKDVQLMSVCLFIISFERALRPCKLLNAERQEIGFGNLRINLCSCCLFSSQITACMRICAIKKF